MDRKNDELNNIKMSLKDEFCVWQDIGKLCAESEVGEEYVLPDYYPDIRKILLVKTSINEGEHFVDSGKVEVGGEDYPITGYFKA